MYIWTGRLFRKILENTSNKIIAFDRDASTVEISRRFKKHFKDRFEFNHKKFNEINKLNSKNIKAAIFDLGYSTDQIFDETKGLSFNYKGNLNMRMGLNSFSAHDVINKLEKNELYKIFKFFGDEKDAKKISNSILQKEKKHQLKQRI